jgi:hypothetical protein
MTAASLVSFLALVISWITLPAKRELPEPTRVSVPRRSAAEA